MRKAFTLVELLVVIAIIGVLVGLLIPAALHVRDNARITQCAYRMGELGKAMISYDLQKQHLPGFVNTINGSAGTVNVAWTVSLLPYIGRDDLWEGGTTTANPNDVGWRGGYTGDVSYIDLYVCPNDSPQTNTPLSFAVSLGSSTNLVDIAGIAANGVFRDITTTTGSATRTVSITDVKSRSQRPMIVENACTNTTTLLGQERQWSFSATNAFDSSKTAQMLGFVWPPSNTNQLFVAMLTVGADVSGGYTSWSGGSFICVNCPPETVIGAFPPIHSGGRLNITFCDGSVRTLTRSDPDDTTDPTMGCKKLDCTNQQ